MATGKNKTSAPRRIFGTDGVRGTANIEPVTAETALKLGRAAAHVFQQVIVISSPSSGTGEEQWLESFRLFPNPNVGTFTVEMLGQARGNGEVEFILYDALGQLVKRETADFHTGNLVQVFQYGELPAGLYTLAIQNGEKVIFAKVVIQR